MTEEETELCPDCHHKKTYHMWTGSDIRNRFATPILNQCFGGGYRHHKVNQVEWDWPECQCMKTFDDWVKDLPDDYYGRNISWPTMGELNNE